MQSPKSDKKKSEESRTMQSELTRYLKTVHQILEKTKERLKDLNSLYPATHEFLKSKGLKHVSQLDETEKKELVEHLTKLRQELIPVLH